MVSARLFATPERHVAIADSPPDRTEPTDDPWSEVTFDAIVLTQRWNTFTSADPTRYPFAAIHLKKLMATPSSADQIGIPMQLCSLSKGRPSGCQSPTVPLRCTSPDRASGTPWQSRHAMTKKALCPQLFPHFTRTTSWP